jgi:hypothetical protein
MENKKEMLDKFFKIKHKLEKKICKNSLKKNQIIIIVLN